MARERYLVGVSEEELQYRPSPSAPMTPKGKLQNIWYHYKWAILGGLFGIVVLTVLIVQMITKEKPDYQICMATTTLVPEAVVEKLEEALSACGDDLNGDGEVVVQIQALNVQTDEEYTQIGVNNRQALIAQVAAGDVMLFAFAPDYYESFSANFEEGFSFFAPLGVEHTLVTEDGCNFVWDLGAFAKELWPAYSLEEIEKMLPDDVIIGVRAVNDDASAAKKEKQQQYLDLLRKYLQTVE